MNGCSRSVPLNPGGAPSIARHEAFVANDLPSNARCSGSWVEPVRCVGLLQA